MEPIYQWNKHWIAISCGFRVVDLKIFSCDGQKAEGTVRTMDHFMGKLEEEMRWVAVSEKVDGRIVWTVSRPELLDGEPVHIDFATREVDFTSSDSDNKRIKTYIISHLDAYLAGKKIDPPHMYGVPDVVFKE
jgi:hypothetical protein